MKYIAAREVFGGYLYFKTNVNESPKWTSDKSDAMRFDTSDEAVFNSDISGIYKGFIISIGVNE